MPERAPPRDTRSRDELLRWVVGSSVLGRLVLGLTVNWISDAYKGAIAPAIAGLVLLVVMAAAVLRRLPPEAPIQRLVAQSGFACAALVTVASLLISGPWRPWLVLAATSLALIACLAPAPNKDIPGQISGVAVIGLGAATIGLAVAFLLRSDLLLGVAAVGIGVAVIGGGVALLLRSDLLAGVATIGGGVAVSGFGVSELYSHSDLVSRLRTLVTVPANTTTEGRPAEIGAPNDPAAQ